MGIVGIGKQFLNLSGFYTSRYEWPDCFRLFSRVCNKQMALERGDSFCSQFHHFWVIKMASLLPGADLLTFQGDEANGFPEEKMGALPESLHKSRDLYLRVPEMCHWCVTSGSKCVRSGCTFLMVSIHPYWLKGAGTGNLGEGTLQNEGAWVPEHMGARLPNRRCPHWAMKWVSKEFLLCYTTWNSRFTYSSLWY